LLVMKSFRWVQILRESDFQLRRKNRLATTIWFLEQRKLAKRGRKIVCLQQNSCTQECPLKRQFSDRDDGSHKRND
jgi:hypothetical protein